MFFVARKKFTHLSPLHVIHHGTLPLLCWWGPRWQIKWFLPFISLIWTMSGLLEEGRVALDRSWTLECTWWCTSTTSWLHVGHPSKSEFCHQFFHTCIDVKWSFSQISLVEKVPHHHADGPICPGVHPCPSGKNNLVDYESHENMKFLGLWLLSGRFLMVKCGVTIFLLQRKSTSTYFPVGFPDSPFVLFI